MLGSGDHINPRRWRQFGIVPAGWVDVHQRGALLPVLGRSVDLDHKGISRSRLQNSAGVAGEGVGSHCVAERKPVLRIEPVLVLRRGTAWHREAVVREHLDRRRRRASEPHRRHVGHARRHSCPIRGSAAENVRPAKPQRQGRGPLRVCRPVQRPLSSDWASRYDRRAHSAGKRRGRGSWQTRCQAPRTRSPRTRDRKSCRAQNGCRQEAVDRLPVRRTPKTLPGFQYDCRSRDRALAVRRASGWSVETAG